MPLDRKPDTPLVPGTAPPADPDLADQIAALNDTYRHHGAVDVMQVALTQAGKIALVSSFGADSVVLLHMAAVIDRATPVLFIDTEMLFTETLVYQSEVSERLGLSNLRIIRSANIVTHDLDGTLHRRNPDACCALRKTAPLNMALRGFDGWITGRKRFQSGTRANLEFFEAEADSGRIKINPLAHWSPDDIRAYMEENRLPRHPLVASGYPSIGCAPCTSQVQPGEDARAGRWRDSAKNECGIHFVDGKVVQRGART